MDIISLALAKKYTDKKIAAAVFPEEIKVPTKTSDLINDSGFVTNTTSNLDNYYKKEEVYTKGQIDQKITDILAEAKESGEFNGKDGVDGKNGADGRTPIKGTDYFTDADKAEMVSAVIAELPVYNGEVVAV